jgi:hypothetical protein
MKFLAPLWILTMFSASSLATHLRGGQIEIVQQNNSGTYKITVRVHTKDTGSPSDVLFGGDGVILDFGDGTTAPVPEEENIILYHLGDGSSVATASFTVTHTYESFGDYIVSYQEPNRNADVINMDNSVSTSFYIESGFRYDGSSYSSPDLLCEPSFFTKVQDDLAFSFAATDSFDNTLYYELVSPQQDRGVPVANYKIPDDFSINPFNGLVTWGTKYQNQFTNGEYSYAVKISQYKASKPVGYMIVDVQLIVDDVAAIMSLTDGITLDTNNRIYLAEENETKFKVIAQGENVDSVGLDILSELVYPEPGSPISFNEYDSVSADKKIKVGVITINANSSLVRDNPYAITVRASYHGDHNVYHKDISYLLYTKDVQLPVKPDDEIKGTITSLNSDLPNISFYPNPTDKEIIITKSARDVIDYKIWDSMGKVLREQTNCKYFAIDTSAFAPGTYFLVIKSSNANRVLRFVKK